MIGSGGREHSLCWAINRSPLCQKLFCAPGNAGIAELAIIVPINIEEVDALVIFAQINVIDFVVIGPEKPLVLGLVDKLEAVGIKAFGPNISAALLEKSKGFMKNILNKYKIPTAAYRIFNNAEVAKEFIRTKGVPIVIKADGLTGGKGVVVATNLDEAITSVDNMMYEKKFGIAGNKLVIEEFLTGEEVSFFAIVDGITALPLIAVQDHKRVGDGDTGSNTGGMGAYSPVPLITPEIINKIMKRCILPTINGMAISGRPYRGVLFAGLMIDKGNPKILEYNVRFGDPECQVIISRLTSDIVPLMLSSINGKLTEQKIEWSQNSALVVVMASKGYPGNYSKNTVIDGINDANQVSGVKIFHAGTDRNSIGQFIATGGRVLNVTAIGFNVEDARERAYRAIDMIHWSDGFYRNDIGWQAIGK